MIKSVLEAAQQAGGTGNAASHLLSWLTVAGLGGLLVEGLRAYVQRKKMGADYADVISQSALRLLTPLEKRVNELERDLRAAQDNLQAAQNELRISIEECRHERRRRIEAEEKLIRRHAEDVTSNRLAEDVQSTRMAQDVRSTRLQSDES